MIEKFNGKISRSLEKVVTFALLIHCSENAKKFSEKCLRPGTCNVTKYRLHNAVLTYKFLKISKKLLPIAKKKSCWKQKRKSM